jgi:Tol biopolymer transport system component
MLVTKRIVATVVASFLLAVPATAKTPGSNGLIAFTRYDANGAGHIVLARSDATHETGLSLPFPADNATWSPDGSKILVSVFRPDASVRPATVNADGSGFHLLEVPAARRNTDIACKAWSPDGRRLLCQLINFFGHNERDGVYVLRASDGGGLRRLTVNPFPPSGNFGGGDIPGDYSPDGRRFVFMRAKPGPGPAPDVDQTGALFVENADGTGVHQITRFGLANSHDNGLARWSPDGSRILFAGARGTLYVIHPDGEGLRSIKLRASDGFSFAFTPGWSPDGTRIVFSLFLEKTGQEDIYTASPDGKQVRQLTNTPDFEDFADWGTLR